MATAKMALAALLQTVREVGEASHTIALATANDEQTRAEARGAYQAYEAIARQIEALHAEDFSDPDSVHTLGVSYVDLEAQTVQAERALRLRQNCALLRDDYETCWDLIKAQYPNVSEAKLAEANPTFALILTTMTALDAMARERSAEDEPLTNETLANLHNYLEAFKAELISGGDRTIQ